MQKVNSFLSFTTAGFDDEAVPVPSKNTPTDATMKHIIQPSNGTPNTKRQVVNKHALDWKNNSLFKFSITSLDDEVASVNTNCDDDTLSIFSNHSSSNRGGGLAVVQRPSVDNKAATPEDLVDLRRKEAANALTNNMEWKKLRNDLKKKRCVTTGAIRQALLKADNNATTDIESTNKTPRRRRSNSLTGTDINRVSSMPSNLGINSINNKNRPTSSKTSSGENDSNSNRIEKRLSMMLLGGGKNDNSLTHQLNDTWRDTNANNISNDSFRQKVKKKLLDSSVADTLGTPNKRNESSSSSPSLLSQSTKSRRSSLPFDTVLANLSTEKVVMD